MSKVDALVKLNNLTGKEMELDYMRIRSNAKKLGWKQVQLVTDELDKKTAEVVPLQREFSIRQIQMQAEVTEKSELLRIANCQHADEIADLMKTVEAKEEHVVHLMTKLKDNGNMEAKLGEHYKQELGELYRETAEESPKKDEELEDAVSSLQFLLNIATSKYSALEVKFKATCKSYQDSTLERDETLKSIRTELENANRLIDSFQSKGLADEMIQSLSPAAAAAATSTLQDSKSLTQIHSDSEYHELMNEVVVKKPEVTKLNREGVAPGGPREGPRAGGGEEEE